MVEDRYSARPPSQISSRGRAHQAVHTQSVSLGMTLPRRYGYNCGLCPGPITAMVLEKLIQSPLEGVDASIQHRPELDSYLRLLMERYQEVCRDLLQAAHTLPVMAIATCVVRIRRRFAELFNLMLQEAISRDVEVQPSKATTPVSSGVEASNVMKRWFLANLTHPYPNNTQKEAIAAEAGISFSQVNNWFVNVRMRVWRPLVKNFGFDVHSRSAGIFPMTRTQESLPIEVVNDIINELRKVE